MKIIAILLLQTVFLASSSAFGRNGVLHTALTFMSTSKGHETLMPPLEKHPDFSTVPANEFLAGMEKQENNDVVAAKKEQCGCAGSQTVDCRRILEKAKMQIQADPEMNLAQIKLFLMSFMPSEYQEEIIGMHREVRSSMEIDVHGSCNQMNVNVGKADQYVKEG